MIKVDNGNIEIKGIRGELLLDFAFILDELLKEAPEIVLAVSVSRADNLEKAYNTADNELVAALIKLLENILKEKQNVRKRNL